MTYLVEKCEIAINIREDLLPQVGFPIPSYKLTKKQLQTWHEEYYSVLNQIRPDQHIQYVYVNDPLVAEYLLNLGVLKPTKRVGKERYVVDKTKVFASWEPTREWLNSLSDIEFNKYIEAYENDDLMLVVPNEV